MKLNCNCCDGIYNSFDVHFTSACDNKCAHCIDGKFNGINRYDTSIQSIHVKTVNIDNLTKIEKRNYVPDMLVINVNNIFLNVDTI